MLKKIQLFLAYAFMGQMVCSVLAYGVVLQASHVVLSLMTCVCGVALAFYLHRVLRENREIGLPVDTLFMWDVYFDIMVFLLFIPAWVEDYEEEPWWPIAVTVCMLCAVDFVRQLLVMFSDCKNRSSSRTLLGGYDKSVPRMPESPSYRIRQGNSTTFNVRIAMSLLVENAEDTPHTTFVANKQAASGVKKWIAHSESFAKGIVRVNAKAAEALMGSRAVSLLMVGVTAVEGDFEEGDIVNIIAPDGRKIGLGRSAYSNTEATALVGKHDVKPIVHYDYLIVNELTS